MKDFKEFVELEEGLKPEHKMRPGWMIKADPVLKAKIAANKAKQKEMKALLGQKLKEDAEQIDEVTQGKSYTSDQLKKKIQSGNWEATHDIKPGKHVEMRHHTGKRVIVQVKEEVEQIDELSSDTLQKYKTAAHKSISNAAVKRHAGEMGSSEYRKNQDKRSKGINRADADKRLGTYKDKTPKKLDISGSASDIQKKYHSGSGGSRMSEELVVEGAYEKSEENKRSADAAKKQGDMFAHHLHMADHHDNLAQWHGEKGRHSEADKHAEKAEEHHEKAMALKEEVEQIDELSNDTLASYKKKAGESASEADKKGDFEKGNKRFKGIMKATFKQFANDAKK